MGFIEAVLARIVYYPSIVYNVVTNKIAGRNWYNRINDHLLLGAIPLKFMTHALLTENVKGVIAMNEAYELTFFYNTKQEWKHYGIKFLHLPTPDLFAAPTESDLLKALKFIDQIRSEGGDTLVHCKAGKARSTVIVVCHLMREHSLTPDQAYAYVKEKRPQVWMRQPQFDLANKYYTNLRYSKQEKHNRV